MAILKFEPAKECTFLRVKNARDVQDRVVRYRTFCRALEFADLVERALHLSDGQGREFSGAGEEGAAIPAKGAQRWSVTWVSPADKTGGAP